MEYITKTGYVKIHIDTSRGNAVTCSRHPYESEEIAKTAIYYGPSIQEVGIFKIEWEVPDNEANA